MPAEGDKARLPGTTQSEVALCLARLRTGLFHGLWVPELSIIDVFWAKRTGILRAVGPRGVLGQWCAVTLSLLSAEQALYSLECSFHPVFSLTSGTCRLDYRRPENR